MCAKDATGDRLFSSDEFLTVTQIAGFFSGFASKKTLENDDQEGVEVAAHEACLERIIKEAASEIAPKHPIVYDAYNTSIPEKTGSGMQVRLNSPRGRKNVGQNKQERVRGQI